MPAAKKAAEAAQGAQRALEGEVATVVDTEQKQEEVMESAAVVKEKVIEATTQVAEVPVTEDETCATEAAAPATTDEAHIATTPCQSTIVSHRHRMWLKKPRLLINKYQLLNLEHQLKNQLHIFVMNQWY